LVVESYIAQKQPAQGVQRLKAIVAANPGSAPLQQLLGQWYVSAGDMANGQKAFEAAKTAHATFWEADIALAQIDQRANRLDAARQRVQAVLSRDPKNITALLLSAEIEEAARNRAAAIARYRAVLDVDGQNLFALNNLAYSLAQDNPDEALKYAQQAGEIAPKSPTVQDTLGWVYYRKGIYGAAIDHLKAAVAKEPTPKREFHLAMSYLKSGDHDLGQKTLRAALQSDPNVAKTETAW
jgi:tetratricopeptide (TPR) repeat protein